MTDSVPQIKLQHRLEAAALRSLFALFARMSPERAGRMTGAIAAFIGPKTGRPHRTMLENLALALPERTADHRRIAKENWRSLGTAAGELPHTAKIADPANGYLSIEGREHLEATRAEGRGVIAIAAHYANWELLPLYGGVDADGFLGFYRPQSNPLADSFINAHRTSTGARLIAKDDRTGLRQAMTTLRSGGTVGILFDQRLRAGIDVPFMGQPALTMPIAHSLAEKTGAAVIPLHFVRTAPARYRVVYEPEIALPDTGNRQADRMAFLTEVNRVIGQWIRETPEQWFWAHRRWSR